MPEETPILSAPAADEGGRIAPIAISDIEVDETIQARVAINPAVIDEYAEAMGSGDTFPPVVLFQDAPLRHSDSAARAIYWLADGFHRVKAAQRAGIESLAAEIHQGSYRDAALYAAGVNATHGLRRTNADKGGAVMRLLTDDQWSGWSDREIARRCNVSNRYVSNLTSVRHNGAGTPSAIILCITQLKARKEFRCLSYQSSARLMTSAKTLSRCSIVICLRTATKNDSEKAHSL